jgi:hypothetical protein
LSPSHRRAFGACNVGPFYARAARAAASDVGVIGLQAPPGAYRLLSWRVQDREIKRTLNMSHDRDDPELDISWRTRELGPKLRRKLFNKVMPTARQEDRPAPTSPRKDDPQHSERPKAPKQGRDR